MIKRFVDSTVGSLILNTIGTAFLLIFNFWIYEYFYSKIMYSMTTVQIKTYLDLLQQFEAPEALPFQKCVFLFFGFIAISVMIIAVRVFGVKNKMEIKDLKMKIQRLEACQE